MDMRRDVVDARGGSSAGISGKAVGDYLYRETAGNRVTVGVTTTTIRSVFRVEGLRRGWAEEGGLVMPRGNRETTSVQIGRNLAGG